MHRLGCLVLLGLVACSSDGGEVDMGSLDFRVAHHEERISPPMRQAWLYVLDDADTAVARALREEVAAAMRLPDGGPYSGEVSSCPGDTFDPSHNDPIDIRVAVAHASQTEADRWTTPAEVPALSRQGERDDLPAHEAWLSAVRSELLRAGASSSVGQYSPVETIHSALSLLSGKRVPSTEREQTLLDTLGLSPDFVSVFLGSTRDDASIDSVSSYGISSLYQLGDSPFHCELRTLFASDVGAYFDFPHLVELLPGFPRLLEFTRPLQVDPDLLESFDTPQAFFSHTGLSDKMVQPCWRGPPIRHDDGSIDCRVHVVTSEMVDCDSSRGWLDPLVPGANGERAAKTETASDGTKQRVCEIQRLEGEALATCLESPETPQLVPGWCYPPASADCTARCPSTGTPIAFRFVAGSTRVTTPGAILRYDCSIEPGE